jgi:hypothetical protein
MKPRRAGTRLWGGLAVAGLLAATAVASAPLRASGAASGDGPPSGKATGWVSVDGKRVDMAHAYAEAAKDYAGADVVWVLITEQPLDAKELKEEGVIALIMGAGNRLGFQVKADGVAEAFDWKHPGWQQGLTGCSSCREAQVQGLDRSGGAIRGTAVTTAPIKGEKHVCEFKVSFHARVQPVR